MGRADLEASFSELPRTGDGLVMMEFGGVWLEMVVWEV